MMGLKIAGILAAAAMAGGFALAPERAPAGATKTTVKLGDNFFSPQSKRVRRGTAVKFKWVGDNRHNVTKKGGPGGKFKSATTTSQGVNFRKTFKMKGTYKLICTIHAPSMKARLRVK